MGWGPLEPELEPGGAALARADAPLDALDLLAIASRAAARIACEQNEALRRAARALETAARNRGCVWVVGAAGNEHARQLNAVGHTALASTDLTRLPPRAIAGDVLLVSASGELPAPLLAEATRRRLETIVLGGPASIAADGLVIRVPCYDGRALSLTHGFIVMALCAEAQCASRAESAA
jgi:hypothetical protein